MGKHRATLRTPKAHRAKYLIPQSSLPGRTFCGWMCLFLAVLIVAFVQFGAITVVPADPPEAVPVAYVAPVSTAMAGCWR
jgi:hypothetical protein